MRAPGIGSAAEVRQSFGEIRCIVPCGRCTSPAVNHQSSRLTHAFTFSVYTYTPLHRVNTSCRFPITFRRPDKSSETLLPSCVAFTVLE